MESVGEGSGEVLLLDDFVGGLYDHVYISLAHLINMQLTAEYLAEQEQVIRSCMEWGISRVNQERYKAVTSFVKGNGSILSVGSAGLDPVICGATHALDVSVEAERILRKNGWTGAFFLGDCRELPWPDKAFPTGYCTEVVEHLPEWADVVRSFEEMDRVCRSWLVTTPVELAHEPFHKRAVSEEQVGDLCRKHGAEARKFLLWWFIWKGKRGPEFTEVKEEDLVDERIPGCVRRFILR